MESGTFARIIIIISNLASLGDKWYHLHSYAASIIPMLCNVKSLHYSIRAVFFEKRKQEREKDVKKKK